MIHITKQIFMGGGDHSFAQMGHLYREMGRAFEILGGIQQPPSIHEPKESCEQHMEDCEDGQRDVERIAKQIFLGLTGKRCVVKEPEPEPIEAGAGWQNPPKVFVEDFEQPKPDPEARAPLNVECSKCGRRYCDHEEKY